MVQCSVLGCKSNSEKKIPDLSFHSFPDNDNLRRKWIHATGRINWTAKYSSKMCGRHFDRNAIFKKKKLTFLHPNAVPKWEIPTLSSSSSNMKENVEVCNYSSAEAEPVAISTSKKSKCDLNEKSKTVNKLRENNRYLRKRLITLKATVKKLQENASLFKEETLSEENDHENKRSERSGNMSKLEEEVVLPKECGLPECRTCLQVLDDNSVLVDLFQCWVPPWDGMESTIAEDLAKLANIQITQTDLYSKVICEPCCLKLQSACDFTYMVRKNDSLMCQKHPETENIDNDSKIHWPKPIQIDKNINGTYENYGDVEIKQEAMSEDEYNGMEDNKGEIISLDIKIEPEELIQPILTTQENEQISRAKSPHLELNGHVFYDSKEDNQLTNGIVTNDDLLEVKEEPLSDIEDVDVVPSDLPLVCMLCSKEFNSVTGLKAHVIAQHSYKTVKRKAGSCSPEKRKKQEFVCGTCQRRFLTSTDLMVHETCHNKSVCYACSAKFDSFEQLTNHSRNCKAIANKELQKPKTLEDVKRPIIRDTFSISQPIKPDNVTFKCESCSEEFSDKYYLTIHEEIYHTKSEHYSEVNENNCAAETEMDTLRSVFGSDSS